MTAEPHSDDLAGPPSDPRSWWTDPNAQLGPRGKAVFVAVCAVIAIAGWIGIGYTQPSTAATNSGYSVSALHAAGYTDRDINYLTELDRLGYPYNGPAAAVEFGRAVGALRAQGVSPAAIKAYTYKTNRQNSGPYTDRQMEDITRAALTFYS